MSPVVRQRAPLAALPDTNLLRLSLDDVQVGTTQDGFGDLIVSASTVYAICDAHGSAAARSICDMLLQAVWPEIAAEELEEPE